MPRWPPHLACLPMCALSSQAAHGPRMGAPAWRRRVQLPALRHYATALVERMPLYFLLHSTAPMERWQVLPVRHVDLRTMRRRRLVLGAAVRCSRRVHQDAHRLSRLWGDWRAAHTRYLFQPSPWRVRSRRSSHTRRWDELRWGRASDARLHLGRSYLRPGQESAEYRRSMHNLWAPPHCRTWAPVTRTPLPFPSVRNRGRPHLGCSRVSGRRTTLEPSVRAWKPVSKRQPNADRLTAAHVWNAAVKWQCCREADRGREAGLPRALAIR
jgi:hypothetical protein